VEFEDPRRPSTNEGAVRLFCFTVTTNEGAGRQTKGHGTGLRVPRLATAALLHSLWLAVLFMHLMVRAHSAPDLAPTLLLLLSAHASVCFFSAALVVSPPRDMSIRLHDGSCATIRCSPIPTSPMALAFKSGGFADRDPLRKIRELLCAARTYRGLRQRVSILGG
jgi:hypothetical protein